MSPELPIFTELELEYYRLQAIGMVASKLGVWDDLTPKSEEDLRTAIGMKDSEALTLLDEWIQAYRDYCKALGGQRLSVG